MLTISFDTLLTVPALTLELQCTSSLFKRASLFIEDFGITPKHASERRPLCAFPLCLEMEHPSDLNEWLTPLIATSENDCHSIRCSCSSENSTLVLEIPETETRIEVRNLTIISESGDQSIDFLMATQACKVWGSFYRSSYACFLANFRTGCLRYILGNLWSIFYT